MGEGNDNTCRSPTSCAAGAKRKMEQVCDVDHLDVSNHLEEANNSYFSEKHLEENGDSFPSSCSGCLAGFGIGGQKMSRRRPAHLCRNAKLTTHPCKQALCNKCFLEMLMKTGETNRTNNDNGSENHDEVEHSRAARKPRSTRGATA